MASSKNPLPPRNRLAMRFALLVMPDDRPASRMALRRFLLRYWRGGGGMGRRWQRRTLRAYSGAQRLWIQIAAAAGIWFAKSGIWQLPVITAVLLLLLIVKVMG